MNKFKIIFKNNMSVTVKAKLYEWPKSPLSKMLYLYDDNRKVIGMYDVSNIISIELLDNESTSSATKKCYIDSETQQFFILADECKYVPDTNILKLYNDYELISTVNLNAAYGYYIEQKELNIWRKKVQNLLYLLAFYLD